LINLCSDEEFSYSILDKKILSNLVKHINEQNLSEIVELNAMLLNNLTTNEKGAASLLQIKEPLFGVSILKLFEIFVFKEVKGREDPYAWIASILMNITQLEDGRALILNKDRSIFPLLFPFVSDSNINRRRGILGVIRNCCFDTENIAWALTETNLILTLMLPLRGSEVLSEEDMEGMDSSLHNKIIGPNKVREKDLECRKTIVECFMLLCKKKNNRELLQKKGLYPILREYEKEEKDEGLNEKIHSLVEILMFADWEGLPKPKRVEEKYHKTTQIKQEKQISEEIEEI